MQRTAARIVFIAAPPEDSTSFQISSTLDIALPTTVGRLAVGCKVQSAEDIDRRRPPRPARTTRSCATVFVRLPELQNLVGAQRVPGIDRIDVGHMVVPRQHDRANAIRSGPRRRLPSRDRIVATTIAFLRRLAAAATIFDGASFVEDSSAQTAAVEAATTYIMEATRSRNLRRQPKGSLPPVAKAERSNVAIVFGVTASPPSKHSGT
jgi:hypothetical protein